MGAIVKNSGICSMGDPKTKQQQKNKNFRVFGYIPSTILRTAYRKQFYPKPMVPMESRVSEGVPFAIVWRVCDRAFGRYRPLNGAEKWSRDYHENWKFAHRHKSTDFKNSILFYLRLKITRLSRKSVSEQWRQQALV